MSNSCDPWTVAHQAPMSMGFSRHKYWSGLPFPSPGDLPHPGIKPRCPALQANSFMSEPPGKPNHKVPAKIYPWATGRWFCRWTFCVALTTILVSALIVPNDNIEIIMFTVKSCSQKLELVKYELVPLFQRQLSISIKNKNYNLPIPQSTLGR